MLIESNEISFTKSQLQEVINLIQDGESVPLNALLAQPAPITQEDINWAMEQIALISQYEDDTEIEYGRV